MESSRDFWTIAELAAAARLSESFVRKAIAAGELPSVMFGTVHRIRERDAAAFLSAGARRLRRSQRKLHLEIADEFQAAGRR
ncbi:MAG: helix-turn-helix domain-containing protein [Pseudomonadota bacterium]|nr:helix-turn-helix domain-containing protein [Pseudomonadota bacterium]